MQVTHTNSLFFLRSASACSSCSLSSSSTSLGSIWACLVVSFSTCTTISLYHCDIQKLRAFYKHKKHREVELKGQTDSYLKICYWYSPQFGHKLPENFDSQLKHSWHIGDKPRGYLSANQREWNTTLIQSFPETRGLWYDCLYIYFWCFRISLAKKYRHIPVKMDLSVH